MPLKNSRSQAASFFQEIPKYEIAKSFKENQLDFKVSFNISTINYDYEAYDKKYNKQVFNGVKFNVVDDHKLEISVQHKGGFEEINDRAFRSAIGVASRHNLYSTDIEDILKRYQKHLEENHFEPPKLHSSAKFQSRS